MERNLLIGIILGILPIIAWYLQFHFSKKRKELHLFKKHLPTHLMDWLFVPFNFFWIYIVTFGLEKFIILGIASIIVNYISARYYIKKHQEEKRPIHLFSIKNGKNSVAGNVHAVFSIIQMFLIFVFIFSSIKNIFVYINVILLFSFLILALLSSKKIHGRVSGPDFLIVLIGTIILILKLII